MEVTETFFDTGEVNLRVMEGPASGPPLVLIHGSTGGWGAWYPLLPHLVEHWHVFVPDLRGHGKSGRAKDFAGYHLNAFARDISSFLRGRVREPAVLFGHSWGAVTATLCGGQEKELVKGLILEDPPVMLRRGSPIMQPYMDYFAWVGDLLRKDPSPQVIAQVLQQQNPNTQAESLMPWAESLSGVDPLYTDALLTGTDVARGINFDQTIQDIPCPILLLVADLEKGGAMEEVDVDLYRSNARNLEVVYFKGVGHGIHDERPAQVLEMVDAFARKI